jgi:hypothetical protein
MGRRPAELYPHWVAKTQLQKVGNEQVAFIQAKAEPIVTQLTQQILQARLNAIGTDPDQPQTTFARGGGNHNNACTTGQFVSAIAVTAWNSDHNDALVADIGVQCRKAVP